MLEQKVPCENCITLSICKARVKDGDLFDLMGLTDICNPFRQYIFLIYPPTKRVVIDFSERVPGDIHLMKCIKELKNSLLYGIDFNEWF